MKAQLRPLGLYIHIPFCKSKCIYCDFYSLPRGEEKMDDYVAALCRHLKESAPRAEGYTVDTVYFGGGTPSYLGTDRLLKLLKCVKKHYTLSKTAEVTLEANPDSATELRALKKLRRGGFNRISLGVQSTDDALLRQIGRIHSADQVRQAVETARKAGFENLSLDLIYGLPGQDMSHWQKTLADAVALQPEHLSCYGLKVEEGTPLCAMAETLSLPGDELQADMYLYTVDYLQKNGYEQYEISNFARNGQLSRHNMKYWQLQEYMGFGPGAHSDFGGTRYAFLRDLAGYIRGVENGGELLSECQQIPPALRDTEYLMLGLRTAKGISGEEFTRRFRLPFGKIEAALTKCQESGYALQQQGFWRLTAEGFLLSNQIIGLLWQALAEEKEALERQRQERRNAGRL